jgi:hypothetical protein
MFGGVLVSHLFSFLCVCSDDFSLLLPNNDLLQQFEDYVFELRFEKGRRKEKQIQ